MVKKKGRKKMEAALKICKDFTLEDRLRYIAAKSPVGKTKDGKIILDKNDSSDVEWYEVDEYGDK